MPTLVIWTNLLPSDARDPTSGMTLLLRQPGYGKGLRIQSIA